MADEPKTPTTLGAVLRAKRRSIPLSLEKLARLCDSSFVYLNQIERERKAPSVKLLQLMAKHLGLDIEPLLDMREQFRADHNPSGETFPPKHPTGREPKLNEETMEKFFGMLRATGAVSLAAASIGVSELCIYTWREKGKEPDTRPIYHKFEREFEKHRLTLAATMSIKHHRHAVGGVYKLPKRKERFDDSGKLIPTDEAELDADGNPVHVDTVVDMDMRATEWTLSRIAPDIYGGPAGTHINNINNNAQQINVRPSLVDMLKSLGPIPDDDYPLFKQTLEQITRNGKLNGNGAGGGNNGTS